MDNVAIAIAVVTGLTQVVKKVGVSSRYVPAVALIIGITYGLIFVSYDFAGALAGIITGLSSVGLYSGVKNTVK